MADAPWKMTPRLDFLLDDLAEARIGATFNQYRQAGELDQPGGPRTRLANLRHYLLERAGADTLALGEAAGYQGMRWSGIAFTSERDLARWGGPYRPTSTRPRGWSEPSGSIVHRLLEELGAERRVILWNTVPTHPHRPGDPLSNRRPSAQEVAVGAAFAFRLIEIVRPRVLVAVGRVAASVLGARAAYVRHPANAGATAFALGLRAALSAG